MIDKIDFNMNIKRQQIVIFDRIKKQIDLPFMIDQYEEGSVCFANSKDIRSDYKLYFTLDDVVYYVYGVINHFLDVENSSLIENRTIPFPINTTQFWDYVLIGKELHHNNKVIEYDEVLNLNWEKNFI